jgi:hypothetical protein
MRRVHKELEYAAEPLATANGVPPFEAWPCTEFLPLFGVVVLNG